MKRREVIVSPEARDDLLNLYDWIADASSEDVAAGYLDRVERYIRGFDLASERGSARDDIRKGLRIVGFERRITMAFSVTDSDVIILRVLYAGRGWDAGLGAE